MMRTDEKGNECPGTLGEYRDMCAALGGEGCAAVVYLDGKIRENVPAGRDERVIAPDSQMRALLMPMLIRDNIQPTKDEVKKLVDQHLGSVNTAEYMGRTMEEIRQREKYGTFPRLRLKDGR